MSKIEKSWAKLKLTKLKTRVLYIFDVFVNLLTLHPRKEILTLKRSKDFQLPQSKNSPFRHSYASLRCVFSVHTNFSTYSTTQDFSVQFYGSFQYAFTNHTTNIKNKTTKAPFLQNMFIRARI